MIKIKTAINNKVMIDESENTISFYGTLKQYEQIKIFYKNKTNRKNKFH